MSYDSMGDSRVGQLRAQVAEVKEVMSDNINKVMERGDKLDDLGERAELMKEGASMFQSQATRLKRKLWWQNVKLWLILIIIILIILAIIVIIVVIVVAKTNNK